MGIFDKLKNEFIDIIEWKDDTHDTMVWRFPRYQSEIKNGAQLTVRESQVAVLVDEGKMADVFQPGRYELKTENIPILTTIRGWKYGFNSPFKVDVYFVNTKEFLNMRWGTATPVTVVDPSLHKAINLRAYGSYNFKISSSDPTAFLRRVAGTNGNFDTDSISEMLRSFAVTEFSDYLGEHEIPAVKLASNLKEFSQELTEALKDSFKEYGLELTKFLVESISLPKDVQEGIDKAARMAFIGAENMTAYTQMQFADSMRDENDTPNNGADTASSAATDGSAASRCRAATTATADHLLCCNKRTTAGALWHATVAADDSAETGANRHTCLETRHGRMGGSWHSAGTGQHLCPDTSPTSTYRMMH